MELDVTEHRPRFKRQRVVANLHVECPAGTAVGETLTGSAVRCRAEHEIISTGENPSSLQSYCLNAIGYRECPTWRKDREAAWDKKKVSATVLDGERITEPTARRG